MASVLRVCIEPSVTERCQVPTLVNLGSNSAQPGMETVSRALDFSELA